jgi:Secretion system C-terminal sorting domain
MSMKAIITPIQIKNFIFCAFLLFSGITGFCQPDYAFSKGKLISGTANLVGAKYRFSNVRPGIDGIITITDLKKITLDEIDGGSGYDDAFQPILVVPKKTKGYAEFKLDFVTTGTTTLRVMTEVPLTAIDIDGFLYDAGNVYEYDEFKLSPSYYIRYDMLGASLDVKFSGNWVQALNTTAVDCAGVDTVQKNVMFTIVHASISSTTFRVGADNENTDRGVTRLRSVYFKKFNYPSGAVLAQSPIINFNGQRNKNNINLNWEFSRTYGIKEYVIERAANGNGFTAIASGTISKSDQSLSYKYADLIAGSGTYSYRLKVVEENEGKITYSNTIVLKENNSNAGEKLAIYPNLIRGRASVQVKSETTERSTLQVVDYSGKLVYKEPVQLTKGTNSFNLDLTGKLAKGNYLVVLSLNGNLVTEKIIIQ